MKILLLALIMILGTSSLFAQTPIIKYQVDFEILEETLVKIGEQIGEGEQTEIESEDLDNFYMILELANKIKKVTFKDGLIVDDYCFEDLAIGITSDLTTITTEQLESLRKIIIIYEQIDIIELKNGNIIKIVSDEDSLSRKDKRKLNEQFAPIKSYKEFKKVIRAEGGVSSGGGD